MGKKNKSSSSLGRALIKDRFSTNKGKKYVGDKSMLHTTEIQDGYDWNRINLQSVTEESSFQEFLSTAQLAGTEFRAEKLNIKFINPRSNVGLLTVDEIKAVRETHDKIRNLVTIPRRPTWNSSTTPDLLDQNEREYFVEWRRNLSKIQEDFGVLLTPYEKNLEFWRQLWRVVERSDVIIQIVDARNPILFHCEDLQKYVKEISKDKINLMLINKSDFLSEKQREYWASYFDSIGVQIVFFSALVDELQVTREDLKELDEKIANLSTKVEETAAKLDKIINKIDYSHKNKNSSKLLSRDELIELFHNIHKGPKVVDNITTIGLVGYPNVGKSSTINTLMSAKKVSVSATPGKTKHFQTLFLDKEVMLCDCPGLVMPTFVFTKAEMIVNGILPIDQMRDHVPPINLVSSLIPRHIFEDKYGIMLPMPLEGEDPGRCSTAEELLNSYAFNRGFMTANGQPDNPRAARYILKDYMNGKLLFCHAPPNIKQEEYHTWAERQKVQSTNRILPPRQIRAVKPYHLTPEELDKMFFKTSAQQVHSKGVLGKSAGIPETVQNLNGELVRDKPWKKINKHENKNKKEKLRRVYAHLDQH